MIKKALVVGLAVMVMFTAVSAPKAGAQTISDLLALIAQLQAQLAALQGQGGTTSGYQFTRNLTLGSTGADVKELQKFLNAKGFVVSASGAGSVGLESTYFGGLTKAALAKFQAANAISPAVGYFGPITRAKVNSMGGGGGVVPVGSGLRVEQVAMAAGSVPTGSIYNPILKIKLTAGEATTVTGLKVVRGGFIANTNVTGVTVWDDAGVRYGNIITSLTSNGEANFSFGNTPIVLAAGQSKTISVAANLASGSYSGTISFSLLNATSVVVSGTTAVNGTFPITGIAMNVVDGSTSLGDVRVDDKGTIGVGSTTAKSSTYAGNVEIGYTDREVYKFSLTQNNSKEAVKLEKIRMYIEGTIVETTDLSNFKLVAADGTVIATAARAVDRYVDFILATPFMIDKGVAKDFTVKVDITGGADRYFTMYVLDDYDVVVRGATTGAGILVTDSAGGSLTASDVTNNDTGWNRMKVGTATVYKASSSPSGNIAPGSQNVVLARFNVQAGGDALEIRKIGLQVKYAVYILTGTLTVRDTATSETYLSISADTTGIVTTTTPTAGSLLTYQQNLSSYITLAAGQTKTIEVIGSISQSATSTSNYTAYTGQYYAKRINQNDYQTLAASAVSANTLTVQAVSLTVTKDTSMANVTRSSGATNQEIARFKLQASAADDIRLTTANLSIGTSTNVQNVKLMEGGVNGTQLGNTIGTPAATGNTFSFSNYVIAKDTTKTLSVYADILSNATDTTVVSVADSGISGVGVNSSVSLSDTPSSDTALQTVTIGTPTLTIAADSSQPSSKIVLAGNNGVEIHKIKFSPTNEDLTLKKITLQLVSGSTTIWTAASLSANLGDVMLYNSLGTLLGTGSVNSSDGTVVITGLNVALAQDTDTVLTVKVNINAQATIVPKSVQAIKVYSTTTTDMEVYSSQGLMSTGVTLTSSGQSNFHLYTVSAPTITRASAATRTGTVGIGNDEVSSFTITNPGTRDITLASTTFEFNLTATQATSSIGEWRIYEAGAPNTLLDSDATVLTSAGTSTIVNITFDAFAVTQVIPAGGSKTYLLRVSTTNVNLNPQTSPVTRLSVRVNGSTGYDSTDDTSLPSGEERYWADGKILYSYVTTGSGGDTYSNLLGSDSGVVNGTLTTY